MVGVVVGEREGRGSVVVVVGWDGGRGKGGTHRNADLSPRPVRLEVCQCFSAN